MAQTEELIKLAFDMKKALLAVYDLEAIILFGSLGRGEGDEFSDVDLLLVIETDQDVATLGMEISEYLDPISKNKHIIVKTPRDYCTQRDVPGTIVFSAVNEGRILFDKKGWQEMYIPLDSYDSRKNEIIKLEYIRKAYDFLTQANTFLKKRNLFRCRDAARFGVARAIKGIFVKHDIEPPRDLGLVNLLSKAKNLEPGLVEHHRFFRELEDCCPNDADILEVQRISDILDRTVRVVNSIIVSYSPT